jgi:hypothetical protein
MGETALTDPIRPPTGRLSSPYPVILAVLLIVLALPFCLRKPADWDNVFVPAAVRLRAGEDVFQHGFVFPPVNASLALPFSYLPRYASLLAWYAVSATALAVLLRGAWRLSGGGHYPGAPGVPRREHLILLAGLACGLAYAFDCLGNRHTDLLVAALVITGCLRLAAGRPLTAGVWFGVAAGLKCTPLLWAPYLAWRRRFAAAGVVVAVAVAVNVLPDLTHPLPGGSRLVQWVTRYLAPMADKDRDPGTWASAINFNHSVAGVCNRWLTWERDVRDGHTAAVPSPTRTTATTLKAAVYGTDVALILVAVLAAGLSRRRVLSVPGPGTGPSVQALEFSLVLLLMVLLSPMSSKPHFCTLVLPGLCLARLAVEQRDRLLVGVLIAAAGAALLSNKDLWGTAVYDFALWYGSVFANAVVLFFGCAYAVWRYRQTTAASQSRGLSSSGVGQRRRAA